MDDKFREAQRAYDNASPYEGREADKRYTNYPCDKCGKTRVEITLDKEDGYIPCCDKCGSRVTNNQGKGWDSDDEAYEAWEAEMWKRFMEEKE